MATFKAIIQDKKKDGTFRVKIRVIHNAGVRRIPTNIFVSETQVTRTLKIKDQQVIDQAENLIRRFRSICNTMGSVVDSMPVDALVKRIKEELRDAEQSWRLDFIAYMLDLAKRMTPGTASLQKTTANALMRFTGRSNLDISEINFSFLTRFETFLRTETSQRGSARSGVPKKGRAVSLYIGRIRSAYNTAKNEFNDEEAGIIRIPWSPFSKYKIKPDGVTKKRALSAETIQKIIELPYTGLKREDVAKDCFLLSFCLFGMNSVDMLECPPEKEGEVVYYRKKTASRRADKAEMRVKIPSCIASIVDKYRDTEGRRLFGFYQSYGNRSNFTRALNKGLSELKGKIGVEDLTFYAARHSMATIACSSAVGINKSVVHEMLNHVDPSMKVTDI
ncbi:MAG: site-specific integrase [Alistipes sp.]|nr:site-specific integrase [Alistipes sp.]